MVHNGVLLCTGMYNMLTFTSGVQCCSLMEKEESKDAEVKKWTSQVSAEGYTCTCSSMHVHVHTEMV